MWKWLLPKAAYIVHCCDYHTVCPVNRRVRDKYEAELKEVERSERSTLEKYNAMKVSSMSAVICATTTPLPLRQSLH